MNQESKNNLINFALLGASFLPMGRAVKLGSGIIGYAARKLGHNMAKKAGSTFGRNVPNKLTGVYSGRPYAKEMAWAYGLKEGAKNTAKQVFNLDASKINRFGGVSKITYDINHANVRAIHRIIKDPKNWDLRQGKYGKLKADPARAVKELSKEIQGQNNTNIGLNVRYDLDPGSLKNLSTDHFYGIGKVNSHQLRKSIFKSNQQVEQSIKSAWEMNNPGMPVKVAYQKATRLTGSHRDAQMNKSFAYISNAFHRKGAKTVKDFKNAFKGQDTGVRIHDKPLSDGRIMFEYSPDMRSDLYKGGFNVRALLNPKTGKVQFNLSDELDIGGRKLKKMTELGMDYRVLNVMKSKEITVPEIGKTIEKSKKKIAGIYNKPKTKSQIMAEKAKKPRDMKSMTDPDNAKNTQQLIDEIMSSKQLKSAVPMTNREFGHIRQMMDDVDDITKGYKSYNPYWYGTRIGLPVAATAGTAGLIGYTLSDD